MRMLCRLSRTVPSKHSMKCRPCWSGCCRRACIRPESWETLGCEPFCNADVSIHRLTGVKDQPWPRNRGRAIGHSTRKGMQMAIVNRRMTGALELTLALAMVLAGNLASAAEKLRSYSVDPDKVS